MLKRLARGLFSFSIVFALPAAAQSEGWNLFGTEQRLIGDAKTHLPRERYERLVDRGVGFSRSASQRWRLLVEFLKRLGPDQQIRVAHRYFRDMPYRSDQEAFGREDYWASVPEFMLLGGDCEDFALAQFHSLLEAGFPEDDLRIVLVEDVSKGFPHAALAARLNGKIYLLDNQFPEVVYAKAVHFYQPLYSISRDKVWAHAAPVPKGLDVVTLSTRDQK